MRECLHSHLANVTTAIGETDLRACEGTQAVLAIFGKLPRREFAGFRLHRQPA